MNTSGTSGGTEKGAGYSLHQLQGDKQHGVTRTGHLLKKSEGKMRRVWQKRRCRVQAEGFLDICHADETKPPTRVNLLTCQIKLVPDDKRCFDLISCEFDFFRINVLFPLVFLTKKHTKEENVIDRYLAKMPCPVSWYSTVTILWDIAHCLQWCVPYGLWELVWVVTESYINQNLSKSPITYRYSIQSVALLCVWSLEAWSIFCFFYIVCSALR